jgi:tRNA G37 N-methylase TrmD
MPTLVKSDLDASLEAKREELRLLNAETVERRQYYREQKQQIDDLVEQGNMILMALNHDIMLARRQLRDIRTDVRTMAQDKVLLTEDLAGLRVQIGVLVPTGTLVITGQL